MRQGPKDSRKGRAASSSKSEGQTPSKLLDFPFKPSEISATAGSDQEQGYVPFSLEHVPRKIAAPFDIFLKAVLKDASHPSFLLCCPRGQVFPKEWILKLQQIRIANLYFAAADMEAVLAYLQSRLDRIVESTASNNLEKAVLTYEVLQVWIRKFFSSPQVQNEADVAASLKFVGGLLDLVRREKANLGFIFDIRRHDNDLYTHCLNACLLGLAFVTYLGWSPEQCLAFGLGALVHDIGLVDTPRDVLRKKTPLTEEEREQIERHPNRGYKTLKNFGNISADALMMVLQHHENGDGSGYPQELQLAAIHPWARILRILDTYEAMTAARPWRPARPPRETLWAMLDEWQKEKKYDPGYLKAFIKFLGEG
jgi:HD-GYP domain-containing protein (c-di-GMP phosphodiesterase class II)